MTEYPSVETDDIECINGGHTTGNALSICERCLHRSRRLIDDIKDAANTPYAYTLGIQAIRYDKDITSGTTGETTLGATPAPDDEEEAARIAALTGHNILAILRDPPNILEPILDWADTWAAARNETAHDLNVFDYLKSRLQWAANNPSESDWHQFHDEARTIRARLRQLVGLTDRSEPVPCVHCGGRIIQHNGAAGYEDHRTCTGCGLIWGNREQLQWVNMTYYRSIPDTHPDALVTTEDARRIMPDLKRNTLNQWIRRGIITPAVTAEGEPRKNARGQLLYRVGDIHARHLGQEA